MALITATKEAVTVFTISLKGMLANAMLITRDIVIDGEAENVDFDMLRDVASITKKTPAAWRILADILQDGVCLMFLSNETALEMEVLNENNQPFILRIVLPSEQIYCFDSSEITW